MEMEAFLRAMVFCEAEAPLDAAAALGTGTWAPAAGHEGRRVRRQQEARGGGRGQGQVGGAASDGGKGT